MNPVTVTTISVDNSSVLLECTECGPLGVWPPGEVMEIVHDHLGKFHNCDMDNVRIDPLNGDDQ